MKKSSILTKIMLAMVMLMLVFALIACDPKPEPDDSGGDEPPAEKTLADQIVDIIKSVDPLLKSVKGITADSTVSVDLGLNVAYKSTPAAGEEDSPSEGNYGFAIKGNVKKTNPELAINLTNSTKELFNLTYIADKLYLNQPLTTVNTTSSDNDKVMADLAGISPAVDDLMYVVMEFLAETVKSIPDLNFEEMGDSIGGVIDMLGDGLANLIEVEQTANGTKIVLGDAVMGVINGFLPNIKLFGEITAKTLVDLLFDGDLPNLTIEINQTNGAISGLKLGYSFDANNYGNLSLDLGLKVGSSNSVTVPTPTGYTAKALGARVDLGLPQKGVDASLEALVNPDLSAEGKNLAYAALNLNGQKLEGIFDGSSAYFNTAAMYAALNGGSNNNLITKPDDTNYKATLQNEKGDTTFIKMINDGAAGVKADYIANKDKKEEETPVESGPTKSLFVKIYQALGGDLAALGTVENKNEAYKDPTEKQMLAALNGKIGNYVRFKVDEDTYVAALKNIIKLFNDNEAWLIGVDLINNEFAKNIETLGDLFTFEKWINQDVKKNDNGIYGIFNWDTTNWKGGVKLFGSTADEKGLIDAVNVFACWGKTNGTPVDFNAENLSEVLNYYIAMLYYYGNNITDSDAAAIEAAETAYVLAKNDYWKVITKDGVTDAEIKDAESKLEAAKEARKNALKAVYTTAQANVVITEILGYTGTGDNYLADLLNSGLYIGISCTKDGGLNGAISIQPAIDSTEAEGYLTLGGYIGFVENNVEAKAAAADIDKVNALELAKGEKVLADDPDADEFKIAEKWEDGTVKLDDNGAIIYEMNEDGSFVYSDRFENGSALLEELFKAQLAYREYAPSAAV